MLCLLIERTNKIRIRLHTPDTSAKTKESKINLSNGLYSSDVSCW